MAGNNRRPSRSDLVCFRNRERVFKLDIDIADGAIHLRMAKQQLDGPGFPGLAVDPGDPGSTHRMRAAGARFEANRSDPLSNKPGKSPRQDVAPLVETTLGRDARARSSMDVEPSGNRLPRPFNDFEAVRVTRLALADRRPFQT